MQKFVQNIYYASEVAVYILEWIVVKWTGELE